jgi:hypothetical protein
MASPISPKSPAKAPKSPAKSPTADGTLILCHTSNFVSISIFFFNMFRHVFLGAEAKDGEAIAYHVEAAVSFPLNKYPAVKRSDIIVAGGYRYSKLFFFISSVCLLS